MQTKVSNAMARCSTSSQSSKLVEGVKVWVKVGKTNHLAVIKRVHRRTVTVKWWTRGDIEEVEIANIEQMSEKRGRRHEHASGVESNPAQNAAAVAHVTKSRKVSSSRGSNTSASRYPPKNKFGDIGYTFYKLFKAGWFEGKVIQIRTSAKDGKTRRVEYSDGDLEDLSIKDLRNLARFAKKRTCSTFKPNASSQGESRQSIQCKFDQNEYDALYRRYLTERSDRKIHVLPSGITIRRCRKGRYIDLMPQCKSLKQKIDALLQSEDHQEVFNILNQLREWEINPQKTGIFHDQEDSEEVQYQEYIDLTQIDNFVDLTADENCPYRHDKFF